MSKRSKWAVTILVGAALAFGSAMTAFAAKPEAKPEAVKTDAKMILVAAKAEAKPEA